MGLLPATYFKAAEAGQRCRCTEGREAKAADASPPPGYPRRFSTLGGCKSTTRRAGSGGVSGPVPADSDFQQRALCDLSWALAVLQGVHNALICPAPPPPPINFYQKRFYRRSATTPRRSFRRDLVSAGTEPTDTIANNLNLPSSPGDY